MPVKERNKDVEIIRPFEPHKRSKSSTGVALPPITSTVTKSNRGISPLEQKKPMDSAVRDIVTMLSARFLPQQLATSSGTGIDLLLNTFKTTVDFIASDCLRSSDMSLDKAFESFARHILSYKHDTEDDVVADVCRDLIRLREDEQKKSSRQSEGVKITRAIVGFTLSALDQLLSHTVRRHPALEGPVVAVRSDVQSLIFVRPVVSYPGSDGGGDPFQADGLPRVWSSIDLSLARNVAHPYVETPTFAEVSGKLLCRLGELDAREAQLRRQLALFGGVGARFARARCNAIVAKAFTAWRGAVHLTRAFGRFDSDTIDQRKRLFEVTAELTKLSARRERERAFFEQREALLTNELTVIKRHFDSSHHIAERTRRENASLKQQVADLQRGALQRLQDRVVELEAELDKWRTHVTMTAVDHAHNPWEDFSRRRGEAFAGVQKRRRYPSSTATAATGIALAEELASPFVSVVLSALAVTAATAKMPQHANGSPKRSISVSDAMAAQAARGSNLHAATRDTALHVLCLFHAITPGHISLSDIRQLASGDESTALTARLSGLCAKLGIPICGIASVESISRATKAQLELFVCGIVARFAGVGAMCPLLPTSPVDVQMWSTLVKDFASSPFGTTTPKLPTASETVPLHPQMGNVAEFLQHTVDSAQSLGRWKAWGTAMLSDATATALVAAEGGSLEPPLSPQQQQHVAEFRTIPPRRFEADPCALGVDTIDMLQTDVLTEAVARGLRRVFVFYASGGAGKVDRDARMSLVEFDSFFDDSRLAAAGIASEEAVDVFRHCARPDLLLEPEGAVSESLPAEEAVELQIGPSGFIEFLVRASHILSQKDRDEKDRAYNRDEDREKLRDAMITVIDDHVLYNCSGGPTSEGVSRMLRSKQVAELLEAEKGNIQKIFRMYTKSSSSQHERELNPRNYLRMLGDAGLISSTDMASALAAEGAASTKTTGPVGHSKPPPITGLLAHQIYYRVLELSSPESDALGIPFDAFNEIICALAMCVDPSPFTAPHHRLRNILELYLLPLAANGAPTRTKAATGKPRTMTRRISAPQRS